MNRSDSIRKDRSYDNVARILKRMRSYNHESFKTALYNFFIVAGILAFVAVCFILGPFLRPLLWAFLIGAVLFPLKRKVAHLLNDWFERLEKRDSNIFVGLCLGPLEATEHCGNRLVGWVYEHWQILVAGTGVAACVKLLYYYAPKGFLCGIWRFIVYSHTTFVQLLSLLNIYVLIAIVVIYLTSVCFLWNTKNSIHFALAGQSLWVAIVCYFCSFLGALQVPAFFLVMLYVGLSICFYLRNTEESSNFVEKLKSLLDKNFFNKSISDSQVKQENSNSEIEDISLDEKIDSLETLDSVDDSIDKTEESQSDLYFKLLFYACMGTFLYRNVWMVALAALPSLLHLIFLLGNFTGATGFITTKLTVCYENLRNWALEHHSAVLPLCLPGILELNYKINTVIRNSLKSSVDVVTSILMIILMLLVIVFLGVFFCVNIYSETLEVAYLGKDLINKTITDRPELVDILPANIQSSIDDALDNAHHYGRRKIETYIDDWLAEADTIHATKLKQQILDVWDRLIQYWIDFNKSDSTYGPRVPTDALKSTFGEIVDNPGHFKELVLVAKQGIIGWAQSNTQTILEVAESLWHIVRTNLSMILSFTGEILSLLLSGGQACVEFVLEMIVFFTVLFYLLSSSNTKYAPLQIADYLGISSSGSKIADALENSISGVLLSLFKCSVFTGLFTWLMHTILGARIVFLPSALAAILSAAPFLGSYWCALPAFLELWLAQDRFYAGIILFLCQFFVPPYFEAAIYAEMKGGGHSYLTGLAIAGGMYWLGWQGAIFGPLMLSFFIGMLEVASVSLRANEEARRSSDEDTRTTNSCLVDVVNGLINDEEQLRIMSSNENLAVLNVILESPDKPQTIPNFENSQNCDQSSVNTADIEQKNKAEDTIHKNQITNKKEEFENINKSCASVTFHDSKSVNLIEKTLSKDLSTNTVDTILNILVPLENKEQSSINLNTKSTDFSSSNKIDGSCEEKIVSKILDEPQISAVPDNSTKLALENIDINSNLTNKSVDASSNTDLNMPKLFEVKIIRSILQPK